MAWVARWTAKLDPYLLLLLALSGMALAPLLSPGYFFEAHDGRHSVFYLLQFDASIRDGALWPRWAMHHIQGYGYPTFLIVAPLGFYVAELFVLLGAGYTAAVKLTWAVGFLASAWGMYHLTVYWIDGRDDVRRQLDRPGLDRARLAALAAGLLYVYIPYHLADIYVRGALADSLLFAWFPWVFWAFDRLIAQGGSRGWPVRLALAMVLLAGTLLTHTFALISFMPLLATFVLFRLLLSWRQERSDGETLRGFIARTLLACAGGLGGLLLCSAFILPLWVEGQALQQQVYVTDTYDFRNHFVYLGQFFSPAWGFGFSDDPQGAGDGMGFQVGLLALLLLVVAVYVQWMTRGLPRQPRWLMAYLTLATLGLLFFMTPAAAPLWERLPLVSVIQFPWRLLALSAFTVCALGGLAVYELLDEVHVTLAEATGGVLVVGLLTVLASAPYVNAQLQPVEPWREDGRAIFRFEREHPDMIAFTQWVKEPFTESPMSSQYADDSYREEYGVDGLLERLAIVQGDGQVISQYSRGSSAGGVVRVDGPATVRIHLLYFPGWQITVDGQPAPLRVSDPHGLIQVDVPAGEHRIDVVMGATPARTAGMAISWLALIGVAGLLLLGRRWRIRA